MIPPSVRKIIRWSPAAASKTKFVDSKACTVKQFAAFMISVVNNLYVVAIEVITFVSVAAAYFFGFAAVADTCNQN